MRRCPACHWINLNSDYRCRRCGYFLRRHPHFSKGSLTYTHRLLGQQKKAGRPIRWDWVLALTAVLGVLVGLGQLSWYWVEPMLKDPPPPDFGFEPETLHQRDYERTHSVPSRGFHPDTHPEGQSAELPAALARSGYSEEWSNSADATII